MSLLSDALIATAEAKVAAAEAKLVKARAQSASAEQILAEARAELIAVLAAPEIPDAYHSGAHTIAMAQ